MEKKNPILRDGLFLLLFVVAATTQ